MYEARAQATKIFRLVTEIEYLLKPKMLIWRIM